MADANITPEVDEDPPEDTYDPSEVEATVGRQQGLGVGAKDLQRQRDPAGFGPGAPADADDDAD